MSDIKADFKKTQPTLNAAPTGGKGSTETPAPTEDVTRHATEEIRATADAVADTVARATDAASEISQQVAEQGREVIMLGVRAAAGMNGRIVELGYGRSHHWLSAAAQTMDIYRHASESAAEQMQALFASCLTFGRGMQQLQHTWLNLMDHAVERATHSPQDLLRCKSAAELAEVQRDLFLDTVNRACEASGSLLQVASRTAQDAMRPLQGEVREVTRQ